MVYVEQNFRKYDVILWGHSLGTSAVARAISVHSKLIKKMVKVTVLEAPFADAVTASKSHPFTKPSINLYGEFLVNWAIDLVAKSAGLFKLASLENMVSVKSDFWPKILILH